MDKPPLYCLFYNAELCYSFTDWGIIWQSVGVISSIIIGASGLYKIYIELKELNKQKQKQALDDECSAQLTRTDFFLRQHRRLFDDEQLFSVLSLIDSDDIRLKHERLWDAKRKLLTFFEEIALLVYSNQINKDVAHYMFGYYVLCIVHGKNFAIGIDPSREHWGLLYRFADDSALFLEKNKDGPPDTFQL